jgi:hypothetical protein
MRMARFDLFKNMDDHSETRQIAIIESFGEVSWKA